MSSRLQKVDIFKKMIDLTIHDIRLRCKVYGCSNSTIKSKVYYVNNNDNDANNDNDHDDDEKLQIIAAEFVYYNKSDWNCKFNPQILQDGNICLLHEWLCERNVEWLLLKDNVPNLRLKLDDNITIKCADDNDLQLTSDLIKIALRIVYKFRSKLRDALHIYIRQLPFVLLKQYLSYIKHYLNKFSLCKQSIAKLDDLIQLMHDAYSQQSYCERLSSNYEAKFDQILMEINPDLITRFNYKSKTIQSKELLSIFLFTFIYFYLVLSLHFIYSIIYIITKCK